MMLGLDMTSVINGLNTVSLYRQSGQLRSATGVLTCTIPTAIGDVCEIRCDDNKTLLAEVIGFDGNQAYLVPFDHPTNLRPGLEVVRKGRGLSIPMGRNMLGRVIDGLGRPIDGKGPILGCRPHPIQGPAPNPMERIPVEEPFITGQRAIDAFLTCGKGQRFGIFAGSGVGKSTLMGEIAKGSEADVNVIALIGERGREVQPFIAKALGEEGLARSVVIVATCEDTPLMRVRGCQAAIGMADYYREQGLNVMLMVDSLTRLATAQREIGLMLGEPPGPKGYTPSVFSLLGQTVERMGNSARGTITALLTVLVDGDDTEEPISDAVRSFIDGHIVLDRKIAESGRFPAINIGRSISRVMHDVTDAEHQAADRKLRAVMALYAKYEDAIRLGAYTKGSDPKVDQAIQLNDVIEKFMTQKRDEFSRYAETRAMLIHLAKSIS
jgi:flagellum-specific ATP synthase